MNSEHASLVHIRRPHHGLGIAAGLILMDGPIEVEEDVTGRVVSVMVDGPDDLLIGVDLTRPPKCQRCGHDNPADLTRKMTGDHLVIHHGPMSYDRIAIDAIHETNQVRYAVHQPYILVWCSEMIGTMAALQPTTEGTA